MVPEVLSTLHEQLAAAQTLAEQVVSAHSQKLLVQLLSIVQAALIGLPAPHAPAPVQPAAQSGVG